MNTQTCVLDARASPRAWRLAFFRRHQVGKGVARHSTSTVLRCTSHAAWVTLLEAAAVGGHCVSSGGGCVRVIDKLGNPRCC